MTGPIKPRLKVCLCRYCHQHFTAEVRTRKPEYCKPEHHKAALAERKAQQRSAKKAPAMAKIAPPEPPRCSKCGAVVLYAGCPCFSRECFYSRLNMPRPMLAATI